MSSAVSALYEPLIARDLDAIRPAIREFRKSHSAEDLALAVARFAVLSFAPSQHAKHAVIACLNALELREDLGSRWEELLIACAVYASSSRQPWSEPPMMDPPPVEESAAADLGELRAAIRSRDRLQAERWLAARIDDPMLSRDLVSVAAEDPSDMGHKLIMLNTALKLVAELGEKGRFVTMRMAVWELTSYEGEKEKVDHPGHAEPEELLRRLIARCIEQKGAIEPAHAVFLFDAALECGALAQLAGHLERLAEGSTPLSEPGLPETTPGSQFHPYRLGRDLGACLKAHAIARRLRGRFPSAPLDAFVAAVRLNLETAPSFEDWSFA